MAITSDDLARLRHLAAEDRGPAVVVTMRSNGSPLCSVVNAGMSEHPISGEPVVAFVSRGDAARLKHLRQRPGISVVLRSGWQWIAAEGKAELAGPDDALDGLTAPIPRLLRDIFTAAGGKHDNWAEFDQVMAEERRTAVLVSIDRAYSNR